MLVRIKKTVGTYGLQVGCAVRPVTHASGAFEVSDAKAQELLQRGIVDIVEDFASEQKNDDVEAPTAPYDKSSPYDEEWEQRVRNMTLKQLQEYADDLGVKFTARTKKAELIKLIEHA